MTTIRRVLKVVCPCCSHEFSVSSRAVVRYMERVLNDIKARIDTLSALLSSVAPDAADTDGESTA